ncbi:MAG TPA: hypothetical protein VJ984_11305 [Xanthomonadales bacterium]|nr:hypothetical protein [Xanthomonadales bacterium]
MFSKPLKAAWFCLFILHLQVSSANDDGLSGDPDAIADAVAMVETMGGVELWKHIDKLHFVHEWDFVNRYERYIEHEILDLADIRSYVTMKSETYDRIRAYSPEHGYWQISDGEFSQGTEEQLANAIARGPFNIYRLARAISRNDPDLNINFATIPDFPPAPALVFHYTDGEPGGWIVLNARKEPMVWATTQYQYVFGPMQRFGNLWVPNWATTSDGLVRYEMVSLEAANSAPDLDLFAPPG